MTKLAGSTLHTTEFIGHDGQKYIDLAVDSYGQTTVAWLRRRLKDDRYFLVVSVACGHVLKTELNDTEARELYWELPDRLPLKLAFTRNVTVKKSKGRKTSKSTDDQR